MPDEDGGDGHTIVVENALESTEYKSYINAAGELQMVNLNSLSSSQREAFLLNVYQCMYIHFFLKTVSE